MGSASAVWADLHSALVWTAIDDFIMEIGYCFLLVSGVLGQSYARDGKCDITTRYMVMINNIIRFYFLAATKQLFEWFNPSVHLSVRPSVCPSVGPSVSPFWICSHHRIIMKFSGVITSDRSDFHAKGQGQRSKVKVTEVTTQLNRFRTVTPVWIHILWWNDAYSLIMLRRGALSYLKVISQISRSHG